MDYYTFYMQDMNGVYTEVNGLTKRQAVIRYNKAMKELGKTLDNFGYELEGK